MKLSWLFGSSMEARHLLYVYLSVWFIQGGYCAWTARNWGRTSKNPQPDISHNSGTNEDF